MSDPYVMWPWNAGTVDLSSPDAQPGQVGRLDGFAFAPASSNPRKKPAGAVALPGMAAMLSPLGPAPSAVSTTALTEPQELPLHGSAGETSKLPAGASPSATAAATQQAPPGPPANKAAPPPPAPPPPPPSARKVRSQSQGGVF
eukprot:scaffold81648_cov46-Prasinocladus_malaysianus.AAC.2